MMHHNQKKSKDAGASALFILPLERGGFTRKLINNAISPEIARRRHDASRGSFIEEVMKTKPFIHRLIISGYRANFLTAMITTESG